MIPSRIWLLRLAATFAALVYAVLALGSGLDRLAPMRPSGAAAVPRLFATDALEVDAADDLGRDSAHALIAAQTLVARAPIEPFSTALLGAARAADGDDAGADRAFRVAALLGWRVPLTQAYWLAASLAVGDDRIAAQHLDALLRQRPDLLQRPELLAPFEDDPAGRTALVAQLATRPPWLEFYAGTTDPRPSAATLIQRLPVLLLLADHGVVLGCAVIAPALGQLSAAGANAQAAALRQRHCPAGD